MRTGTPLVALFDSLLTRHLRFHESCLNLRERIPPREDGVPDSPSPASSKPPSPRVNDANDQSSSPLPTESQSSAQPSSHPDGAATERFWDYENEEDDDEEDPTVPRALIPAADYDAFICGECVVKSPMLLKWAGSDGCRMVVREAGGEWYVWAGEPKKEKPKSELPQIEDAQGTSDPGSAMIGQKRSYAELGDVKVEGPTKKPKLDSVPCSAPTPFPDIQKLLDRIRVNQAPCLDGEGLQGAGDIFFTPGWRERWCKCESVSAPVLYRTYFLPYSCIHATWGYLSDPSFETSVHFSWQLGHIWKRKKRHTSYRKIQTLVCLSLRHLFHVRLSSYGACTPSHRPFVGRIGTQGAKQASPRSYYRWYSSLPAFEVGRPFLWVQASLY